MEYRCRLGTTSGEIIEGVYVAQSEAALRRELEDKGLHVLSLKPRLGFGVHQPWRRAPQDQAPRVPGLQPGTGDAAEGRHAAGAVARHPALAAEQPGVQVGARRVYEKVRGGTALSDAFSAHGDLFPPIYTASLMAGERAGNLDAVLRRFVAYSKTIDTVRSKTISAMIYPVILIALAIVLVGIIVIKVVPTFAEFYGSFDARAAAVDAHDRGGVGLRARAVLADPDRDRRRGASAFYTWIKQPGRGARVRSPDAEAAVRRRAASTSSRPRSWRARWRRCSAAAFRW